MKTSNVIKGIVFGAIVLVIWIGIAYSAMTRPSLTTTPATTTPTPTATSEAISFYDKKLKREEIPNWLIREMEGNENTIAVYQKHEIKLAIFIVNYIKQHPTTESFKVHDVRNKEAYIDYEKLGNLTIGGNVKLNLNKETTTDIDGLEKTTEVEEISFETVKKVISKCWEHEDEGFWINNYSNYVSFHEILIDGESIMDTGVFLNGEFLTILPDTFTPETPSLCYKFQNGKPRSKTWCDDKGVFYKIDGDSHLIKWSWGHGRGKWVVDTWIPIFENEDFTTIGGYYSFWYIIRKGNTAEIYEPYISWEEANFGLKKKLTLEFKGAQLIRPARLYEGAETPDTAIIAVPEKNELWYLGQKAFINKLTAESVEVLEKSIWAKKGDVLEKIAEKGTTYWTTNDWEGRLIKLTNEFEFEKELEWEEERIISKGEVRSERGDIIIETEELIVRIHE